MAIAQGAYGGYAEHVIGDAGMIFDAPASLDDIPAAAFFFPFHLAWHGPHERGGLRPDESDAVPAALDQMDQRLTTGRTIAAF
jgi:NADPH:quinone reductase-like Zn-dependent oxidoreductase